MPISVKCTCGKSFRLKDELGGRKVRCVACKAVIAVPRAEDVAEADTVEMLLVEDPPKPAKRGPLARDDSIQSETPRPPARALSRVEDPAPETPRPRKRRRVVEDEEYEDRGSRRRKSGMVVSSTIITGLLMIVGAVVWFCGGLAFDIIFFYPPILLVLGIITTVKGFMGRED
jgi:hypothetical protein